jgi:yeast amino acid transporter
MGLIAICFGECAAELVQKFPVYNAMVEYVRVFVDPDLAFVVGIAYCTAPMLLGGYGKADFEY